ncbi:50S ribosomal protein L9 [Cerasicoccus frondis]|uniref:50S ribosomal protein L9 n=1 Tax=Cerasicoccus frondis TaxID=490090 RepID=UPI002852573E|nr:50S ribosomal protein L9 [Cerasicoccus frondis]
MNQDVLLLEPVENLGHEGDQVSVKAGYARNFLLPRKLALPVNRANKKHIEALQARKEARLKQEREHAEQVLARLETVSIAIAVKTGEGGKMFGSVTSQDLVDRLKEDGIEVERKQLNLHTPVKTLGKHTTKVKLHPEVSYELEWEVVSENPIEEVAEEGAEEKTEA